jgi:hypothetical protein
MSPWYIIHNRPVSFRASLSYSPIHLRYAFLSENASNPNILCGSWVITLGEEFGKLQIDFCRRMRVLSSLLIVGNEKATV